MSAHPIHIAILDDDVATRVALRRLLAAAGMVVDTYATGDLFFESLERTVPDCLLLDFRMPEMDGLEVLTHLRQQRIAMNTIVMTGHEETGTRAACMEAGAIAYLLKPVDTDHLIDTIKNAFGSSPPLIFG